MSKQYAFTLTDGRQFEVVVKEDADGTTLEVHRSHDMYEDELLATLSLTRAVERRRSDARYLRRLAKQLAAGSDRIGAVDVELLNRVAQRIEDGY